MKPLLFPMPGEEARVMTLAKLCDAEVGEMNFRRFPDGEAYFRLEPNPSGRSIAFVCGLDHPDAKLLTLMMAADTAIDLGARRVGLVAPYLPYMRQDRRFRPGEPVSARLVARLIGERFHWLVTVDPHLHRIRTLSELYSMPTGPVSATPLIADWIRSAVAAPFIVGPDVESEQWVAGIAARLGCPHVTLAKDRSGDRKVEITAPDLAAVSSRTAVLVDDIASSGATLVEAVRVLRRTGLAPVACVVVHALCPSRVTKRLHDMGARLVSIDTVAHPTNAIDCTVLLASETRQLL